MTDNNNGHNTYVSSPPFGIAQFPPGVDGNQPDFKIDHAKVQDLTRQLLIALGQNPDRDGLKDTPARVANWWREFLEYDPGKLTTAFENQGDGQLVIISGIRVWSLCEHHLLPFWADITIGYVPNKQILGLSKFARIAHYAAHRLQVQENLVKEISDSVKEIAGTEDVGVIAVGQHLCMTMRGIKSDALMTTINLDGIFRDDQQFKQQIIDAAKPTS